MFVFAHHSFRIVLFHDVIVPCSPLDYLPTLLFLRRLPHLDAPVTITSSVSNVNVSVQLGDTTPFALGFLSASAGTEGLSHAERKAGERHMMLLLQSKTRASLKLKYNLNILTSHHVQVLCCCYNTFSFSKSSRFYYFVSLFSKHVKLD